jgi:hypothetical protein
MNHTGKGDQEKEKPIIIFLMLKHEKIKERLKSNCLKRVQVNFYILIKIYFIELLDAKEKRKHKTYNRFEEIERMK